jgi:hypothetical protein
MVVVHEHVDVVCLDAGHVTHHTVLVGGLDEIQVHEGSARTCR